MTETKAIPSGRSYRILMVDDSATARRQLRGVLESNAFIVTEAAEGAEALWRARQQPFDVVLTDIHMPTMDGLTFIRELRKLPGYKSIPVLVLTSDCSKERLREGKSAGATGWIVKPPDPVALTKALHEACVNGRR